MNGLNKIQEACTHDILLDSNNNALFVGDLIAYCPGKEYGGGYKVYSDIIKEVRYQTKKVKLLNGKLLLGAHVLKITKGCTAEDQKQNEQTVANLKEKEKQEKIKKQQNKITSRFVICMYVNETEDGIYLCEVKSEPGKPVKVKDINSAITNAIKTYSKYTLYIMNTNKQFEEFNETHSYINFPEADLPVFHNTFLKHLHYSTNPQHKQIIDQHIGKYSQYKYSWQKYPDSVYKNDLTKTFNRETFFEYQNTCNESVISLIDRFSKYYDKEDITKAFMQKLKLIKEQKL